MEENIKPLVAGVVVKKDGKYLMIQEKKEIAHGLWNWPAGHVDPGETIEQAAVRETKEETGYEVKLLKKIGLFDQYDVDAHLFQAEIIGGTEEFPTNEIMDLQWLTAEEIICRKDKLRAGYWIIEAIDILENNI